MATVATTVPSRAGAAPERDGAATLARLAHRNRSVYVQPASHTDIHALHAMLRDRLPTPIATPETACRVQDGSPHSIWSIHSSSGLIGGAAFLPLNDLGLYRLIYGKLDRTDPPLDSLAVRLERPAILYLWAFVAKGRGLLGLPEILRQLDTQRFRRVDIWADPVTAAGAALALRVGFEATASGKHGFRKFARSGEAS